MSSTTEVCYNSNCKQTSEKWRRGWRRRTGEYAHLCDRCASAYEDGKFCETFHMNASGWRCCESCGKQIHCGCIVSFHMFVLLDAGGIECLTCAKKSYILTPNPAWPPPLHFLSSQPERMKDLSVKTWSAIAGSGPVPWRQAPSLFNGSSVQANVQLRMPFEIDVSGGIDRYGVCERLSMASTETKHERSYERLANGKLRLGPSETLQNGNIGLNGKEHCPLTNDFKPIFPRKDTSSNLNLGISSSSKNEIDDVPVSAILSQSPPVSVSVGKKLCSQSGMDSSGDAQIRNGKSRVDGRNRNQLLPRYRPQITDEELQQISGDSKSVITPLFEKMLSASDAGRIGRLVLPKKCAEAYFPPISHPEGLPLKVQDVKGKEWVFQFRFWPNNNSRMYVLEGITPCIQSMHLQAGDVVTFSRLEPEGKLIMGGRKASAVPSLDQGEEVIVIGIEASSPADGSARNKSADVISVNGHMKEKILDDKPAMHVKRKNSNLNAKSKRLRIENEDMMELKLTYKEAQGLMRAPAKIVPSSFVVDGCEFEEFEEAEPIIGRPVILGIDHSGEKIQWVQCEDCFKWRKVPADALVPSNWTCSDNVWDLHRSLCSSAEELTIEQLEQMLHATNKGPCNKEESSGRDADLFVALEGLDALANLAIQGEGEGLLASSENRTKHPRHKPGCTCIVCLQPPSGKGIKHEESCYCIICNISKRRFKTLLERKERKQLEKETESSSSSQNLQSREKEQDIDACPGSSVGDKEHEESCYCIMCNITKNRFKTLLERKERKQLEKETESSSSSQNLQSREKEQDIDACPGSSVGDKEHEESCYCIMCNITKNRFKTLLERKERKQLEKETESSSSFQNLQSREKEQDIDACPGSSVGNKEEATKLSTSAMKGQIDLNIQPEREEDFSPRSDKCSIPERFFRQQRALEPDVIGNLSGGKQDGGVGCVNIRSCVALEGGGGGHKKTG